MVRLETGSWELTPPRLRFLIERAAEFLAILDASATVRYVTSSVEQVLGYEVGDLTGRSALDLLSPDDRDRFLFGLRSVVGRANASTQWECRFRHREGGWRLLEGRLCSFIDETGAFAMLSSKDVTEHASLEAQVRAAQKMEAVGRLAGGVAHDFNNVLTAILGNAELLAFDLDESDPHRDGLREIREAATRAAEITRQLLAFSRKQDLQLRCVAPAEVVTRVGRMLRHMLGEDIAVSLDLDNPGKCIRADPVQLEQVMLNLAVNARDAMPRGGSLHFAVEEFRVRGDEETVPYYVPPADYVAIRVKDSGEGMDRETLQRIFEPFFTTKPVGKGTGLGLSTAYGIVKQSLGYIWAESAPGAGTHFHLLFPEVTGEIPESAPEEVGTHRPRPGTVMLVEDDPAVGRVAERVLARAGMVVRTFDNPFDALAALSDMATAVDLLITDVVMPGLSGVRLAESCRTLRPELPVLFMSGYSGDVLRDHGLTGRVQNVIAKPFAPADLVSAVGRLLSSEA